MDKESERIIHSYSLQEIDKATFLEQFSPVLLRDSNLAADIIYQGISNKSSEDIRLGYIMMLIQNDILGYALNLNVLCLLLTNKYHFHHEDIAMLLKGVKSPETVDSLYYAAELQYDYLNYDDTYQFARKCIKALAAIGSENAYEKLRLLTNSRIPEIGAYARKELRKIHNELL